MKTTTIPETVRGQKLTPATLAVWRERMGYSQRDAAQALGSDADSFAAWERGDTHIPRYIGLAMAALAMGMDEFGG